MKCVRWHYILEGTAGDPVIIFLHGFLGSADDWQFCRDQFSGKFRVLCPDLPGHGRTVAEDDRLYRMPETAQQLVRLMDRLEITAASLVGYSMGGRLALYLAIHYPQRFQRLVLESASPGLLTSRQRAERKQQDQLLAEQLEKGEFRQFLQRWYEQPLFAPLKAHPDFDRLFRRRLANDPPGLARSLRFIGTGNQPSLWKDLKSLPMPVLLMAGEKDPKFCQIAGEMKDRNPDFQIRVVQGCGHTIHFENAEEFIGELKKFL